MKESEEPPFMPAGEYAQRLKGLGLNLLAPEVALVAGFLKEVLGVKVIYEDADFAVFGHEGTEWMIHGDHTYDDDRPMGVLSRRAAQRGAGCELRLFNVDPDQAEARAAALGHEVLVPSADRPHGLRECYLVDPAGYVWVPSIPLPPTD